MNSQLEPLRRWDKYGIQIQNIGSFLLFISDTLVQCSFKKRALTVVSDINNNTKKINKKYHSWNRHWQSPNHIVHWEATNYYWTVDTSAASIVINETVLVRCHKLHPSSVIVCGSSRTGDTVVLNYKIVIIRQDKHDERKINRRFSPSYNRTIIIFCALSKNVT